MSFPPKIRGAVAVTDRHPPYSNQAERALLGCCLMDGLDKVGVALERLRAGGAAFYDLRHQTLWNALSAMHEASAPVDMVTVHQWLSDSGRLTECGGLVYLSGLCDEVVSTVNLPQYLEIVLEKNRLRQTLTLVTEAQQKILAAGEEGAPHPDEVLDGVERDLLRLSEQRAGSREIPVAELMRGALDRLEEYQRGGAQVRGLESGFEYLDKMTGGMEPGQMIVFAARPGMGKTSFAMNVADHLAVDRKVPVAVFSLEMSANELAMRLLFQRAQADFQRFRTGFLENGAIPGLAGAAAKIGGGKLWIDDGGDASVLELRAKARRMRNQHGIKLIVIDYLQLLRGSSRYSNREAEVAEISRSIKSLAKELEIPVIVLAQLNREVEKEKNRAPRLSDLRESGAIEQDADFVGILHRPPKADDEEEELNAGHEKDWSRRDARVNLEVVKQRNGPTGKFEMIFRKSCTRFFPYHRPKGAPTSVSREDEE